MHCVFEKGPRDLLFWWTPLCIHCSRYRSTQAFSYKYISYTEHTHSASLSPFLSSPTLVYFVLRFSFASTLMSWMDSSCVELKSRNHKRERTCWMCFGDWLNSLPVNISSGTCFPADDISSFFFTAGRWHVHHRSSHHPSAVGHLDRLRDGCVQCCNEHCGVFLSCVDLRTFG